MRNLGLAILVVGLTVVSLCALSDGEKLKQGMGQKKKNIFAKEALKSVLQELKKVKSVEKKKGASSDKAVGATSTEKRQWWCAYFPEYCSVQGCASDEYECNDGTCIYDYWQCDGWEDCNDAGDELGCECRVSEFTCANGRCIRGSWQCDDWDDCGDGSDEEGCCEFGGWGEWSGCSTGCGAGQRRRERQCSCGVGQCDGAEVEYAVCDGEDCYPEANEGCGTRHPTEANSRIVGGEDAVRGAWPWQAQLFFSGYFTCGGTLVDNKYVVSAAHCFEGEYADASRWKVQLGKLSAANSIDASYGEYESSVTQIHVHGDYNSQTSDNDIAILVLSDPVPDSTGDFVNIACLDTHSRKVFNETSNCFITGFGATQWQGNVASILQEANVPLIGRDTCNALNSYSGQVTNNMMCAGYLQGGVDSCQGDSGGPLVCAAKDGHRDEERWYLVGVTSWGYGCASPDYPGVYTDVSKYVTWLQEKME
ncbi:serine protease hepsin-like [Asterias rubens]|uniref:serine protease hepsin-like n=1 Tax=Asterias rubens TaxID=7604 RepID=UPI0014553295|nr:serine protease hepsin-like [Asterias rubens]